MKAETNFLSSLNLLTLSFYSFKEHRARAEIWTGRKRTPADNKNTNLQALLTCLARESWHRLRPLVQLENYFSFVTSHLWTARQHSALNQRWCYKIQCFKTLSTYSRQIYNKYVTCFITKQCCRHLVEDKQKLELFNST